MGADARPARGLGGGRPPARPQGVRDSPPARARPGPARSRTPLFQPPGRQAGLWASPRAPHLPHPAPGALPEGADPTAPAPLGGLTAPLVFIPPARPAPSRCARMR